MIPCAAKVLGLSNRTPSLQVCTEGGVMNMVK